MTGLVFRRVEKSIYILKMEFMKLLYSVFSGCGDGKRERERERGEDAEKFICTF